MGEINFGQLVAANFSLILVVAIAVAGVVSAIVLRARRRRRRMPAVVDGVRSERQDVRVVDDRVIASFEAKYANPMLIPAESHIYQTLAAAGVQDAPLAISIYPTDAPLQVHDVRACGSQEMKLATLGLDLFAYRRDGGADVRAAKLIDVITSLSPVPA